MRDKCIILCFILIAIAGAYAISRQPHQFLSNECSICHFNEGKTPMDIKPDVTNACGTCHSEHREIQSHPTDIYPSFPLPKDMPLIEGKLTCITCHYIHPKEKGQFIKEHNFLRRPVGGILFCGGCHKIDEKRHLVLENVHTGSYYVTDSTTSIDRVSLGCIECHSASLNIPVDSLGAGIWNHYSRKVNHPIGISYEKISTQKMRDYRPPSMLPKEIRLFNGKIGCGTCHNVYSKEPFMLVLNNFKSRLCLECHIK